MTMNLLERIEKALNDFTSGRASMHVPPIDTDVDMVLADCQSQITALTSQLGSVVAENAALKSKGREVLKEAAYVYSHYNRMVDHLDGESVDGQTLHEFQEVIESETPATSAFLAEVRASAIPEGYVLVPQEMHLSSEAMEGICFHCGDGDHQFGEFTDGTLFVGEVDYGDGKKVHGLHIATADYPEEGCATICEFAAQIRQGGAV